MPEEVCISIPELHPSINVWTRWHFFKANIEKQRWKEMIGWLCKGIPPIKGPVEVEVVYYFPTKARKDIDNFSFKFGMDGLVAGGLIEDDNSNIVTKLSMVFKYDKLNPRTEVYIRKI